MANPWLSYPVALVIAALVSVAAMAVFTTDPDETQDEKAAAGIKNDLSDAELMEILKSGTRDQRIAAALRLGESDGELADIVPALAKAAIGRDELVRTASMISIGNIGPSAADHIESLFESDDINEFRMASVVLQQVGSAGKQFIPRFKPILKEDNANKVMASLFALENAGVNALPLMDELIALLDHKEFNIQCGVCRIFENMGAPAAPAQGRLVLLLDDGVLSARSWAAIALGAIGPTDEYDVVDLLTKKLSSFTQIEKERAMIGLGHIGPGAKAAIDEVTRLMNDPAKNSQARAAFTLWKITGDIDAPMEILKQKLDSLSYKRDAIQRLGEMGPAAAPALVELRKELDNEEADVVELAILAIGKLGRAGRSALPDLKKKLNYDDLLVRQAARTAIDKIESETRSK